MKDYHFFKETMDRFNKAMKGIPDRVPVYAQIHEFAMNEMGYSPDEFYTDPEKLVTSVLEVYTRYGLDAPYVDFDVYNIEASGIGQRIKFSKDSMPDVDRSDLLIKDKSDIKKIKTPDFGSAGRFPFVIEANRIFYELTGIPVTINFTAPFSLAANIRGIENLIFDIIDDPKFAKELFTRLTEELIIPWILYQKEKVPEVYSIVGSDATASLPILSIEMLNEWVVPYIIEIRNEVGRDTYVSNWIGERYLDNPEKMFDAKLKVSPTFLEGQDPDVEELGPEIYKKYANQHDVSLILGIGTSFLARAKPEDIEKRVEYYIRAGGKGGRFGLYLCNIGRTTPPENLKAAVDAAHKYGKY